MNVAVDPGIANGLAANLDGYYATTTYTIEELIAYFRMYGHLMEHVALEVFSRSNRIDANMIRTMENVGVVRGMCAMFPNIKKLWLHDNQSRKSFIPDAITALEKQGRKIVMTKDKDDHEVDALAHLLLLEYDLDLERQGLKRDGNKSR